MPTDSTALLKGLRPVLNVLDADLLSRAKDPGVEAGLTAGWEREKTAGRTAANFTLWCRRRTAQVSIAWVLSVVFVRTLEDRGFLARRRIAGPGAEDSEQQFTALAPFLTPRDYLLMVFGELAKLPSAFDLFDARHNPVWVLAPSADVARQLLDFFRHPGKKGEAPPAFDGEDTRFLGDLYQKLSEDVRKRFALLQTPEFVEEFILDQTLDPAVKVFGLEDVRLIDPTCGSGHFLLGAFHRLFEAWMNKAPGEDRQVLAQRALQQVHGCDLNPYAVAIARFRLTLEFLQVTGIDKLERAPRLCLNLCVADSLLHGVEGEQIRLSGTVDDETRKTWGDQLFALEDEGEALRILTQRYHAVVGNPPYITETDAKKREKYRELYESAAGQFALAAPFTERFFGLASPAGFVGLINANSFTKRDFGKALITQVLPRLDVSKVVDTSGAYIPGHGTPTLLLFGRNRTAGTDDVTAVLGKRGEAEEPADPATAPVWSEIIGHHAEVGFDGRYVSVEPIPRGQMAEHPWVLVGGGARKLLEEIEVIASDVLDSMSTANGAMAKSRADDVYLFPKGSLARQGIQPPFVLRNVRGENIRDWRIHTEEEALFPYTSTLTPVPYDESKRSHQLLWRAKEILWRRRELGGDHRELNRTWWEWNRLLKPRFLAKRRIAFAFVSTHNHFVLDRTRSMFSGSGPVILLKEQYDEADHLALLGLLNSSTVGLWCRLVMFQKGGDQVGDGARVSPAPWDRYLEYAGNLLKRLPIAALEESRTTLLALVRHAESTVRAIQDSAPAQTLHAWLNDKSVPGANIKEQQGQTVTRLSRLQRLLVSIQEEIDWRVYELYGLPSITAPTVEEVLVPVSPEHRPFEVRLAREVNDDLSSKIWFERHKRPPPTDVDGPLAALYRKRLQLIDDHKELQLLETPETKRRWSPRDYDAEFRDAYKNWLLDRIERLIEDQAQPTIVSARQLAAQLQRDSEIQAVAEVYTNESAPDLEHLAIDLVKAEGVPYVAALRYTDTGLEKHNAWRETWELQRREDVGEKVGEIPVPPRYATGDYRRTTYWSHRGELDVPKERFVLYPGAETDNDSSPWLGWAGWDHLQKATALSGVYQIRKTEEGWEKDRLAPLLAGLHELVPWLIQWHNDPNEAYGGQRLGDFFRDFVSGEAHGLGCSTADLEAWRPPEATRGRNNKKTTASKPKLTAETLLAAFDSNGAELAQTDLADSLGVSSAAVGKVAKVCIEAGQLFQTNGRPKRFALVNAQEGESWRE